jgi:DNA replication and repair protein RecF
MTLKRLFIKNLRNINLIDIELSDQVNIVFGDNGSGKTTILEAINVLAIGRSFRTHKHKPLISKDHNAFTIFGKALSESGDEIPIGISRNLDGSAIFKANGDLIPSAAILATYLPIQVIDSDAFSLLEGGPQVRRQFIDWLVFHVEHNFYQLWKDGQRCLKHRNSLLRHDRIDAFELAPWDLELVVITEKIHQLRLACMALFTERVSELLKDFPVLDDLKIQYYSGWERDKSYKDALDSNRERDFQQGYTHVGTHRADLRITVNGQMALEVLSRGQQKILVCALKIAQGMVFSQLTNRKTIYLIDDLPAELDEPHRHLLSNWLNFMNTQVFITGVELEPILLSWRDKANISIKLFHVEQGSIKAVSELTPNTIA